MLFKKAKELFALKFKDFSLSTGEGKTKSEEYINLALKDVYRAHLWEYRKRTGQVVLIPNYTTGTCSITKYDGSNEADARTVTFSGATLTQAMVGRYLQPKDSSTWYRIVRIDGSIVYLQTPIVDASASNVTFEIWKRFYYLPSEVDVVEQFKNWEESGVLEYKPSNKMSYESTRISTTGKVSDFAAYGIDPYDDVEYSTGTISIPKNSNVVTGADGAAFLSNNIGAGDILEFNGIQFTVKRVESDPRIITHQYAAEEVAGGTAYAIKKDNPLGFQFYFSADDYKILEFTYYRRGHSLYNENKESIYFPDKFISVILDRAQAMYLKDKPDSSWINIHNVYLGGLAGLKEQKSIVHAKSRQFAPEIKSYMPGRG